MKKTIKHLLLPLLIVVVLLGGCWGYAGSGSQDPEPPTDSAPQATTPTPEQPTEPTDPVLTPEQWLLEPVYPSYQELFSKDASYQDYQTDWFVQEGQYYYHYYVENRDSVQVVSETGSTYLVPGTETFRQDYAAPQPLGSDGKYAYFYNPDNANRILRLELENGDVTVLVEEARIYSTPILRANCVVYYIRAAGETGELCRMYIPEQRVDVLCRVENPEYLFPNCLTGAETTLGAISWYGLNPEIVSRGEALWGDSNAKKVVNGHDYTQSWSTFTAGLQGIHQDLREMFFHDLQTETGIWGLEMTTFDLQTGTFSKKPGTLDNCFLGSGIGHDHFDLRSDPLPVPKAIKEDWRILPGLNIQGTLTNGNPEACAVSCRVPGSANRQLFLRCEDRFTLLKDADWTPIESTSTAIYCLTDENTLVELSYDGKICNTLYAANNGTLSNFRYCDGMLCFREGDRVLLLDTANRQFRVLLKNADVYIERWLPGQMQFCFSVSRGLYYQQYLFNTRTGVIEESFIL